MREQIMSIRATSISLISAAADGTPSNGWSGEAVFSPDGYKVAFESSASNLVPGDTNRGSDLFVKDLTSGAITRISTAADGTQINAQPQWPVFSPDGNEVAFLSYVANPGPGGTINGNEIVLKDLTTGALTRVLTAADDGRYANIEFSPDGASLMFASAASNLVPNDTNR